MNQILLVEDDQNLSEGLCLALQDEETKVEACASLGAARQLLANQSFALLLLDINLPDGSGLDLLRECKAKYSMPVILLTAKDTELDIVTGFEKGADDYIAKPFSLAILRARVKAQLRKGGGKGNCFVQEGYSFNFDTMQFRWNKTLVELSKVEQKLLRILVENKGQTLTREILLQRVWDSDGDFVDENTLSVAIKRLRDKLGAQKVLKTVYGIGYCWEES